MKKFFEKIKNKRFLLSILLLAIFFLPIYGVNAYWGEGVVDDLIGRSSEVVIAALWSLSTDVLLFGAGLLVRLGAFLIDIFLNPSLYDAVLRTGAAEDPTAIQVGWTTIRDFCNMFYVFFLLLIAFSTITRNQSYSAKSLLPKIVISMILINFSGVIAKVVIDFGQVFLFGIAGWMGTFSGSAGAGAGLTSIVDYFNGQFEMVTNPTISSLVISFFAVFYTSMLGLLYIMLAGFLLFRLVMFVFLIVVSPFAFFSMVLPSMRKYSSRWWDVLITNAISGPIFIFFIYISAVMAQDLALPLYPSFDENLGWISGTINLLIPHFIALAMLWMAIPATQEIGAAGSKQLIGGTLGLGKIGMGLYAGYKIGERGAKGTAAWGGRRVGYDSNKIGNVTRDKMTTVAGKLEFIPGMTSLKGGLVEKQANKQSQDRAEIAKEKAKVTNYSADTAKTVMAGILAKNVQGRATIGDQRKLTALAEQAISKGASIDDIPEEVKGYMVANSANFDEIAKSNPFIAGELKGRVDKSKDAKGHAEDYVKWHADSGDWKKYSDDFKKNNFALMARNIDSKDLENHIKGSGAKNREAYYYGADKYLSSLSTAPGGISNDNRAKVRKLTGNFEISEANRNGAGNRLQIGGPALDFGQSATHPIDFNASLTAADGAIKSEGGNNFQKLTPASQLIYFDKLTDPDDITGLQLKNLDSGTLRKLADRINTNFPNNGHPVHMAAKAHPFLEPYIT